MVKVFEPEYTYNNKKEADWLGKIPDHWEVKSAGAVTKFVSKKNYAHLPLLSVVREKGVIKRSLDKKDNHNVIPDDLSGYKLAEEGNLIINKMKAWQGSLGIAFQTGIVSPAYYVLTLRDLESNYANWLLRGKQYIPFFAKVSEGVRIGQWDLSIDGFKRIPIIIPPLEEQAAIAKYLSYMDNRIQTYIANKQKLIGLLQEEKQAVITKAVTKGLDENVEMKESGIEWLGEVPKHWKVNNLKRIASLKTEKANEKDKEKVQIALEDIVSKTGEIKIKDADKKLEAELIKFEEGDILFGKLRPYLAKVALAPFSGSCVGEFLVLKIGGEHNPKLYEYFLRSQQFIDTVTGLTWGTKMPRTSWSLMNTLKAPIPPLNEQKDISCYLDNFTKKTDFTISKIKREIELLKEYRTTLISDVVTGKLDVREAAKGLPEVEEIVIEEPTPEIEGLEEKMDGIIENEH